MQSIAVYYSLKNHYRRKMMSDKESWDLQIALNKVSSMTVDEFQTQLDKHKIDANTMDNYVFDLAKALMKSKSNERYIYTLKMED